MVGWSRKRRQVAALHSLELRAVGVHAEEAHAVAHVDVVCVLQHEVVDGRLQRVLLEVGVGQV